MNRLKFKVETQRLSYWMNKPINKQIQIWTI